MSARTVASRHPAGPPRRPVVALVAVPLLLVLLVVVIVLVVVHSLGSEGQPASAVKPERSRAAYWTVRAGDSYTSIAAATGLTVSALKRFNPHQDPAAIHAGQHLRLRRHPPPLHRKRLGPRTWIVRPGESYSSIAAGTGHAVGELQRLNPGVGASSLKAGQRIRLRR